jgi:hypothetical protein
MTLADVITANPITASKLLLGTMAVLALMTRANAAPIAQCVMKSYAEVKAVPSVDARVILSVPDELRVDVLEEFATQWVWVASTDSDYPTKGWVRRASLKFCLERGPFRK